MGEFQDAFAILIAAHHPSLQLLGISTVHGNASLENTTINAGRVLEAIGRPGIPVYPGSKKPFCRAPIHAADIHGPSGLDGTNLLPRPTKSPVIDENPILAMRNALLSQPRGTPWVVATGTLTNIALLFATFPEVAEHIQGLSIMGGAIGEGFTNAPISRLPGHESRIGNCTPWAEFNIYCDPEAAQSIVTNPILIPKTTLISLDLTHQVLATPIVQTRILTAAAAAATATAISSITPAPSVLRQILHSLLNYFAGAYQTIFGLDHGPPLHDPLAVAVILSNLNPVFASTATGNAMISSPSQGVLQFDDNNGERFAVTVVTDGQQGGDVSITGQLGRTIARCIRGKETHQPGIAIPRSVNVNGFWDLVIYCIELAEARKALSAVSA